MIAVVFPLSARAIKALFLVILCSMFFCKMLLSFMCVSDVLVSVVYLH